MSSPAGHAPPYRDYAVIAFSVAVGLAVTAWAWHTAKQHELATRETEFAREVESRHALIRETISGYEESLLAFKLLFTHGAPIDRDKFAAAAQLQLARHPGFLGLQWAPQVSAARRTEWEKQNPASLGAIGRIRDRLRGGVEAPSAPRPFYYPLHYVEPFADNRKVVGSDAAESPLRADIERAMATDKLQFSGLIKLAFERGPNDGIILTCPALAPAPHDSGVILGVFRVADLLTQPWRRAPASRLDVMFIDETATRPDRRLLFYYTARPSPAPPPTEAAFLAEPHRAKTLTLATRRWRVLYRTSQLAAVSTAPAPLIILLGGLALTALGSSYLFARQRRSQLVEQQVRQRTAELSESRRQLDALVHALPGMAYRFRYDTTAAALYVSEGALALTGWSAEDFISGKIQFRNCLHPDDVGRVRHVTHAALAQRRDFEVEYRLTARDGGEKWALSRGRGVYLPDGRLDFVEGLAIDITAQKHAELERLALERRLLEGQKLESLGLLAGGIAHDFNNLLTGILGNASLSRIALTTSSPVDHQLHAIETASIRAAELCRQMLAYAGKGRFVVEPVDLNAISSGLVPLLEVSIARKATLRLDLAATLPPVLADATQLRQIIMNLVINAADATGDDGGTIAVTTGVMHADAETLRTNVTGTDLRERDYVFLEVSDTGCGMTPEVLAKIFDPFFTTKLAGRGLGLAAVLGIVRGHSGALLVSSEPARGSKFRLLLPPALGTPAVQSSLPTSDRASFNRPGQVLVIEDEEPVRTIATKLLATFGLTPHAAPDGRTGLEMFQRDPHSWTLVVIDVLMPGFSGEQTLAELRAIRPNVRVLLMSGYNEGDLLRRLSAPGSPLAFLPKPFTRDSLAERLHALLK
jgi:two-component system cell cycle sensor histidine kinase/response regulator CckA